MEPQSRVSPGLGSAVEELVVAARRTVQAAPVLTDQQVLIGAMHDAVEYRAQEPEWCRDCDRAEDGDLCQDQADDLATADAYDALAGALLGDRHRNV